MEKPVGVIVQYGGQTPLKLCSRPGSRRRAHHRHHARHDRRRRRPRALPEAAARRSDLKQPPNRHRAHRRRSRWTRPPQLGYPLVVRPTYVLGGRAMEIVHEQRDLERYMREAVKVVQRLARAAGPLPERRHRVRRGLRARLRRTRVIGGVMEHIEQAGVHSGDSACSLPPYYLCRPTVDEIKRQTAAMAAGLNVVGLMNVQFAIQEAEDGKDVIYVLEVNPRASRTVPFVSKATGIQLAKVAARCMAGQTLAAQGVTKEVTPPYFSVKEAVFPFVKFPGVDTILGPEMKSTGEVMGVGKTFGEAFVKSQLGAGDQLPDPGQGVPVGASTADKPARSKSPASWWTWASSWWPPVARRRLISRTGPAGDRRQQGDRRPPARGGHDQERRDCHGHQHGGRASQRDCGFARHPYLFAAGPRDHLHHDCRCRGGCRGHEVPRQA